MNIVVQGDDGSIKFLELPAKFTKDTVYYLIDKNDKYEFVIKRCRLDCILAHALMERILNGIVFFSRREAEDAVNKLKQEEAGIDEFYEIEALRSQVMRLREEIEILKGLR